MKNLFFTIFFIISGIQFVISDVEIEMLIPFFINYFILMIIMYYHFFLEKDFSPFLSSFLIFNLLFFIIAPLAQISSLKESEGIMVNNLPFTNLLALKANIYIAIFNVVFFCSYLIFKKRNNRKKIKVFTPSKLLPFNILIILVVCLIVLILNVNYIQYKLTTPTWKLQLDSAKSLKIIISKTFFSIPLAGVALCMMYLKNKTKNATNWLLVIISLLIFLGLIMIFKNPFMEKRSGLGPVYFCLLFLFIPRLINSNVKLTMTLYIAMILLMPILAIFTHVNASYSEILVNPMLLFENVNLEVLFSNFNRLHFDAFANFMATMDLISKEGFSLGGQLSGAILFFVPRSLWMEKPISSGQLVGNHLMNNYDFWFNNLSNPFISEGLLNFGFIGVVVFAILFGYFLAKLVILIKSEDFLLKIVAFFIAIHLIYFLRGDFTNGYSQLVLVSFGIYFIPKTIIFLVKDFIHGAGKKSDK